MSLEAAVGRRYQQVISCLANIPGLLYVTGIITTYDPSCIPGSKDHVHLCQLGQEHNSLQ